MKGAGSIPAASFRSSGGVCLNFMSPVGQYVWKGGGFQKKFLSFMVSTDNSMPSEIDVRIAAGSLILLMPDRAFGVVVCQDQSLIILVT